MPDAANGHMAEPMTNGGHSAEPASDGEAEDRAGAVFGALADPMRRRLFSVIAAHPSTATELANGLPISRQAVAKHLNSLSDAGLLERERAGRDVRYRVTPQPLSEAVSWMAEVGGQWDERLARLARTLER
jgi:DNA-binding transcriptional ArsR family regulator